MTERLEPPRIAIYSVGQYGTMIARLATARAGGSSPRSIGPGRRSTRTCDRVAGLDRDLGVAHPGQRDRRLRQPRRRCRRGDAHGPAPAPTWARTGASCGRDWASPVGDSPTCPDQRRCWPPRSGAGKYERGPFTGSGGITGFVAHLDGVWAAGHGVSSLHHPASPTERSIVDPRSAFNQPPERFYERGLDQSPVLLAHKAIPELVLRALGYHVAESSAAAKPVVYDVPVKTKLIPEGVFGPASAWGCARTSRSPPRRASSPRSRSSNACSYPETSSTWSGRSRERRGTACVSNASTRPRLRPGTCSTASPRSSRRRRVSSRSPS